MNLPSLGLQVVYSHVAWGMVLAACGVGLLSWKRPFPTKLAAAWLLLAWVLCALPGAASPAYWLSLVFSHPSGLLVACCTLTVWMNASREGGYRVLPPGLALVLVGAGAVLYLDSWGWLSFGLYTHGFGPAAALAGVLVGAAAVVAVARGPHRAIATAALLAWLLFALLRLPTGNAWDALLDPMLWLWDLFSLLARARSHRSKRRDLLTA